jgi:hypothetical protein
MLDMPLALRKELLKYIIPAPEVKPVLPYLQELLSLNDKTVRRAKAYEICSKFVKYTEYKMFEYISKTDRLGNRGQTASSGVCCVFGSFDNSWKAYSTKHIDHHWVVDKHGIEIMNAQPNATRHTYSLKCLITVKELKEACKANGLKTTGDKRSLLSSLMKI